MDNAVMDDLAWLRLQVEWGADESLDEQPQDRRERAAVPDLAPILRNPTLRSSPNVASPPTPTVIGVARAHALAESANTVMALRAALEAFDGCALRATATNLVFSDGNNTSGVVLIADVPGAAEDRAGLPFAGPAAAFLDRMFNSAGLDRAAALSTSLLPWRPPGGRPPADAEIQLCLPFLLRHLALLQPRWAVLVGTLAARTLLPGMGRRARGGWNAMAVPGLSAPVPTLVLPAVSYVQTTASAKRDAWADLLRLRRAIDG